MLPNNGIWINLSSSSFFINLEGSHVNALKQIYFRTINHNKVFNFSCCWIFFIIIFLIQLLTEILILDNYGYKLVQYSLGHKNNDTRIIQYLILLSITFSKPFPSLGTWSYKSPCFILKYKFWNFSQICNLLLEFKILGKPKTKKNCLQRILIACSCKVVLE